MHQDDVYPVGGRILLEAVFEESTVDSFGREWAIPFEYQNRYPNAGWYVRGAPSHWNVERDDLLILDDEGSEVDRTYYDVFRLILEDERDGERYNLIINIDGLQAFEEIMKAYYKEPSVHKTRQISVKDVEGTAWTFECQDVLDYGVDELAHPTYELEYIPTKMIELWISETEKRLHYLVDPKRILLILKDW